MFKKLTTICNLIIFHIQLADDTTCAVEGETYNPSIKKCQCGSEPSCTLGGTSGKLRIFHQYCIIFPINIYTGSRFAMYSLYQMHVSFLETCHFEPVPDTECPNYLAYLAECTRTMSNGELCEADQTLPDGNSNYHVNNCGGADVFKCVKGIHLNFHSLWIGNFFYYSMINVQCYFHTHY